MTAKPGKGLNCLPEVFQYYWNGVLQNLNAAQPELRYEQKTNLMHKDTQIYNDTQSPAEKSICDLLATTIFAALPDAENKIWHAHPVWFLDGNPVVGYSKLKESVRLLFWSGQTFEEAGLQNEGKFKAAEIRYTSVDQVNTKDLQRWLKKARTIQWDYKNIVKRKGQLERLK